MCYMSSPLPIRFRDETLARLRSRAHAIPGATPSGLAHRYVEEGLRMADHPGVVFKDGPAGRRAAIAGGPDVWEIIRVLRDIDERGDAAVEATAELAALSISRVRLAMRYYAEYVEEIDAEIAQNDAEADAALRAWQTQRRLLS